MNNVIDFPTKNERSWIFMEPELRALAIKAGANGKTLESILAEMKDYHLELYGEHSTSLELSAGLSNEQSAAVVASVGTFLDEYNEVVRSRINAAQGIIFSLLLQKYGVIPG